ncbi:MAG: hypothetical protein ACE5OO_02175 [Candidatus Bathyarchaeia archaeon]
MKCHKCPVVKECSHIGLKRVDKDGKEIGKGCLILYAFFKAMEKEGEGPIVKISHQAEETPSGGDRRPQGPEAEGRQDEC